MGAGVGAAGAWGAQGTPYTPSNTNGNGNASSSPYKTASGTGGRLLGAYTQAELVEMPLRELKRRYCDVFEEPAPAKASPHISPPLFSSQLEPVFH